MIQFLRHKIIEQQSSINKIFNATKCYQVMFWYHACMNTQDWYYFSWGAYVSVQFWLLLKKPKKFKLQQWRFEQLNWILTVIKWYFKNQWEVKILLCCKQTVSQLILILISVHWKNIEYNYGNHFDGSSFTAPLKGLYSFTSTAIFESRRLPRFQYIDPPRIILVGCKSCVAAAWSNEITDMKKSVEIVNAGHILLQTTVQLNAKDIVYIKLEGTFDYLYSPERTYFEGRLVSVIEEIK